MAFNILNDYLQAVNNVCDKNVRLSTFYYVYGAILFQNLLPKRFTCLWNFMNPGLCVCVFRNMFVVLDWVSLLMAGPDWKFKNIWTSMFAFKLLDVFLLWVFSQPSVMSCCSSILVGVVITSYFTGKTAEQSSHHNCVQQYIFLNR